MRNKHTARVSGIKDFFARNYGIFICSVIYFGMLLVFLNSIHFIDENDNFMGALMVAKGRDVYRYFHSQHMPFAYYIFAVPALLFHPATVTGFRLSFYGIMVILWAVMYFRYKDKFGYAVMLIYPVLYIFSMAFFDTTGCSAISDQFQAQGLAILLLEYLWFLKTRQITVKTSIFVSLAVMLSFGTAFVSALAVFVIALAVFYEEIKLLVKSRLKLLKWPGYLMKKYWHLICIAALPFAVLIVWYLFTDNLRAFYTGAYWLNRNVYPIYSNGPGGSIIHDALVTISWYWSMLSGSMTSFFTDGLVSLKFIFMVAINVAFCLVQFQRNKESAVLLAMFTLMCGIRGFVGFHSMCYYAVTFVMACLLFKEYVLDRPVRAKVGAYALICLMIASFSFQYAGYVPNLVQVKGLLKDGGLQGTEYVIDQLLEPDDPLYVSTMAVEIYIRTQRFPVYSPTTSTPWTWTVYREDDFYYLETYKPKVLIHEDEYSVWDIKMKDYAPDFIEYVHEHYTLLSEDYPGLYVLNEFLPEASRILEGL